MAPPKKHHVSNGKEALSLYLCTSRTPDDAEEGACLSAVVVAFDLEHARTMTTAREGEKDQPSPGGVPRLWFVGGAKITMIARWTYLETPGVVVAHCKE